MCIAVPGRIVQIVDGPGLPMATVDFGGITKECCLVCVPGAVLGDYTTIQSGFATTILDEEAALASLAVFAELGVFGGKADQEHGSRPATNAAGGPAS